MPCDVKFKVAHHEKQSDAEEFCDVLIDTAIAVSESEGNGTPLYHLKHDREVMAFHLIFNDPNLASWNVYYLDDDVRGHLS